MTKSLTNTQRDQLFQTLTKEQQEYVMNFLKQGKKTTFATVIARKKGRIIPEGASEEEIEMLLDDWILDDYIDAGFVSEEVKCECGRALRYQYIVRHVKTGETLRFGINHFEEHTGLPASIIKEIVQGFTQIDYEMDELLLKTENGYHPSNIPEEMSLPVDIQHPLELHLPLLERQEKRLNALIRAFREEQEAAQRGSKEVEVLSTSLRTQEEPKSAQDLQASFDLFSEDTSASHTEKESEQPKETYFVGDLSFPTQEAIDAYIQQEIESALMICELLIKAGKVSDKRYSTQKPKVYYSVCSYLDSFVNSGTMSVEPLGREDRLYRLKQKSY